MGDIVSVLWVKMYQFAECKLGFGVGMGYLFLLSITEKGSLSAITTS